MKIELVQGYKFKVTFPDAEKTTLLMDEPPPLGEKKGPNAANVLAASTANCLSASLLYCLKKARVEVTGISAEAEPVLARNKDGYWRVVRISVRLFPTFKTDEDAQRAKTCYEVFENYCVVTGAVRSGFEVDVRFGTP